MSEIDALTSPTLKHLREHWWNDEFTAFLNETLRPRPGNRILDVGCGTGTAEIRIGRLRLTQIRLFGVDLVVQHLVTAKEETAAHNQRAKFAAADACHLPFAPDAFDSTYCVAVLQHVYDLRAAVSEFARVTRPGGRIVAVEPDNAARYWYSSSPAGRQAFDAGSRFFAALAQSSDSRGDPRVGPKLPTLFAGHGIAPEAVRLFPVSQATLGATDQALWSRRRERARRAVDMAPDAARAAGKQYLDALAAYEAEAADGAAGFVEIQTTMLFATVGQKAE